MPTAANTRLRQVAVLGAAGRVGRAVTAALLQQDIHVNAVLREPTRYDLPRNARLHVVQGDAQHLEALTDTLGTVDAIVLSVTPFTAPPSSFDGFDLDYYTNIIAGIDANWHSARRRLVAIGLTATLRLDSGGTFMEDPSLFPPELTPFAQAHARQLPALAGTTLDWAILAPPAGFGSPHEPAVGQGCRLVVEPLTRQQATAHLTYAQYAQAVATELLQPTIHNARVAVIPPA
ncbi:NAD(P)H-binding protein [Micromonospora sp. NPDC048835]|uniref:NAD(P)-dependent oxidoreductase n=1 Tax=Micromonospora sp. NPDC048835 TaxID=3155147 RepID=UPI0033C409FE